MRLQGRLQDFPSSLLKSYIKSFKVQLSLTLMRVKLVLLECQAHPASLLMLSLVDVTSFK